MSNKKLVPLALTQACIALTYVSAATAADSPALPDDGNMTVFAVVGVALLLVAVVLWRLLVARRDKKPDPSGFMTLEQITRIESPGGTSTLMKVAKPGPAPSLSSTTTKGENQQSSASDPYMTELEKNFPRIVEKLVTMWPDPEVEEFLQGLTFDDRGDREGFSKEVAGDIMMLYGVKLKERGGVWL